jgi:hypothetical protein
MATLKNSTVSRFYNLSDEALADAIGRADAIVKGAEAELATLKDEFKARGLAEVAGDEFAVTATEPISGRIDAKGEGTAGRAIQRLREGHHLHGDPHQGREPARPRGLSESGEGATILPP